MTEVFEISIGGQSVALRRNADLVAFRGNNRTFTNDFPVSGRAAYGSRRADEYVVVDKSVAPESGSAWRASDLAVYHTSQDRVPFVTVGTLYIEFAADVPEDVRRDVLSRHAVTILRTEPDGSITASTASSSDCVAVCVELQRDRRIRVAEPDLQTSGELKNFPGVSDPLFERQWHLENAGQINGSKDGLKAGADARVTGAWRLLADFGSPNVVIGVIDDGFDLSHPDLTSRSLHPWDFQRNSTDVSPVPSRTSPTLGNWHGTACAGVAVGSLNGGSIVGAAPRCSWIPVRWRPDLSPEEVVRWFDYLRDKGAAVISCSWGTRARNYPLPTRIAKALGQCAREGRGGKGCVVVFAAGNELRDINDPQNESVNGFATHPDVISVAASTSLDERAEYSNFGKEILTSAPSSGVPGRDIATADVTGTFIDAAGIQRSMGYAPGDYNEHFGKTSSACPLVAGICGLILSANPDLSAAEVRDIIKGTARKIGTQDEYDASGHSIHFGYGCINAEAAVAEALARRPLA